MSWLPAVPGHEKFIYNICPIFRFTIRRRCGAISWVSTTHPHPIYGVQSITKPLSELWVSTNSVKITLNIEHIVAVHIYQTSLVSRLQEMNWLCVRNTHVSHVYVSNSYEHIIITQFSNILRFIRISLRIPKHSNPTSRFIPNICQRARTWHSFIHSTDGLELWKSGDRYLVYLMSHWSFNAVSPMSAVCRISTVCHMSAVFRRFVR